MMQTTSRLESLSVGILQFPGSNCDVDCADVLKRHFNINSSLLWHTADRLPKLDVMVIPGGFSYGDYLRSGALASHSPIMQNLKRFVEGGGFVIGICNGFQILVESKILPGILLHNDHLKFICQDVFLKDSRDRVLRMPIAHAEGRYYVDDATMSRLEEENLIAFRYCDSQGLINKRSNPNGAAKNIAGIFSTNKRVLGMMPHPERATDHVLGGSTDGLTVLKDFLSSVTQ